MEEPNNGRNQGKSETKSQWQNRDIKTVPNQTQIKANGNPKGQLPSLEI